MAEQHQIRDVHEDVTPHGRHVAVAVVAQHEYLNETFRQIQLLIAKAPITHPIGDVEQVECADAELYDL